MANNIGRIEFIVGADGRTLTGQLKLIGRKSGEEAGGEFEKNFNKHIDLVGSHAEKRMGAAGKKSNTSFWKGMSANSRQWTLIIAAIASSAGEISTLGSAAGSGLAVLGTSLSAVAAAGLVAFVGLRGITGPLSKIAPAAREGAAALKDLGNGFKAMQQPIQAALLAGLAGPISMVTKTLLPVLKTGLVGIASTVNSVFGELAAALSNPAVVTGFSTLLAGFQPIIASLGTAFIQLGGAIGTIFIASLPTAKLFAQALSDMFTQFNAFLNSAKGTAALTAFFDHSQQVFGALVPLIAAAGKVLASLVTEQTVGLLVDFLNNLTAFMPVLGGILGALAKLNIFGLVAEALKLIGDAIAPLLPALGQLMDVVRDGLMAAMGALAPILNSLGSSLGLLLPPLIKLAQAIGDALIKAFIALEPALTPVLKLIDTLAALIIDTLVPVIQPLVDLFVALAVPLLQLVSTMGTALMPVIKQIVSIFLLVWSAVEPLVPVIAELASIVAIALVPMFQILSPILTLVASLIKILLVPVVALIKWLAPLLVQGDGVTTMFQNMQKSIQPVVDFLNMVSTAVSDFAANLQQAFASGTGPVADWVNSTVGMFNDWQDNVFGMFSDFFTNMVTMFVGFFANTIGMFVDFFNNTVGMFVDFFTNTTGMFSDFFNNVVAATIAFGVDVLKWFIDMGLKIGATVSGIVNTVVTFFSELPGRIFAFISGIAVRIGAFFAPVVNFVSGYINNVVGFFASLPTRIFAFVSGIGKRIGDFFGSIVSTVKGYIDNVVNFFRDLPGRILNFIGDIGGKIGDAFGLGNIKLPWTATGGVFFGPTVRGIGEAGPEAVVPLNRPLSQVDPSVRGLSAFAQGLSSGGNAAGSGPAIVVSEGAIQIVSQFSNPRIVANQVLDGLVGAISR